MDAPSGIAARHQQRAAAGTYRDCNCFRDIYGTNGWANKQVGNQTGGQQRKASTQLTDPMRRRHLFHASPAVPVSCVNLLQGCYYRYWRARSAFWSKIAFAAVHKWFIRCPATVSATVTLLCAMNSLCCCDSLC